MLHIQILSRALSISGIVLPFPILVLIISTLISFILSASGHDITYWKYYAVDYLKTFSAILVFMIFGIYSFILFGALISLKYYVEAGIVLVLIISVLIIYNRIHIKYFRK